MQVRGLLDIKIKFAILMVTIITTGVYASTVVHLPTEAWAEASGPNAGSVNPAQTRGAAPTCTCNPGHAHWYLTTIMNPSAGQRQIEWEWVHSVRPQIPAPLWGRDHFAINEVQAKGKKIVQDGWGKFVSTWTNPPNRWIKALVACVTAGAAQYAADVGLNDPPATARSDAAHACVVAALVTLFGSSA